MAESMNEAIGRFLHEVEKSVSPSLTLRFLQDNKLNDRCMGRVRDR